MTITSLRLREAQLASASIMRALPTEFDDAWLAAVIDAPRFGWDWEALEKGFFAPLRSWSERNDARLRPMLAGLLIDALGGNKAQHAQLLAALEMHYLASIMLDDLRNGRDLPNSTSPSVVTPLPVWVTIAYNARQLAPVWVMRKAEGLSEATRVRLAAQFSRLLFRQGLGSALDQWATERELKHADIDSLISHLSVYVGSLSFGLACDVACAAVGLSEEATHILAQAGNQLGVALRLIEAGRGQLRQIATGQVSARDDRSQEPRISWIHGIDPQVMATAGERLRIAACARASLAAPEAGAVFSDFYEALTTNATEEIAS